jgi:hypothetical protein
MKQFITLLMFVLIGQTVAFAAAPTVPSSNLTFKDIDGARFTGNFEEGNGNMRIVVMKEGSEVTGFPVNGVDYVSNSDFGTAGSAFTQPGEFVVAETSGEAFTVNKLKPGTRYYVAIFEYNGTGTTTEYLMLSLTGSEITVTAPTAQASFLPATNVIGNSVTINWAKGNGDGRIVIARKGAPVNVIPADLTAYSPSSDFGSGTKIGTDNYVVYRNTTNTAALVVKNLEPNTTYHFAIFEYKGSSSPVHLTPGATYTATTHAGPTQAPTSATYNYVEGNSLRISVSGGNGTRRLFIVKKGTAVTKAPVNGTTYTANAAFGTPGTEIGTDEYVVAATTNNYVDITNLEPNTTYHYRVFEYDVDAAGNTWYLTNSFFTRSTSTATTPTTVVSELQMVSVSGSSATFKWKSGSGSGQYRMIMIKAGGPVDATPVDLKKYTGHTNFGEGEVVAGDNYCLVGLMNGSQNTANKLQAGVTYHLAIYEFNGDDHPVYSASAARISFTVPLEPTGASTNPGMTLQDGQSFRFSWSNGNGAKRIVIAKKGSVVTATPTDLIDYTANKEFQHGEEIKPGEFVVLNSSATFVELENLEIGATYHFAVFEYNVGQDGKPDYLTSSFLIHNASTVTWPTTQPVINNVSNIQAAQATISYAKGNGSTRLFVMKKGSPVSVLPQDAAKYNYSGTFGHSSSLISDGNYVVNMPTNASGTFNVTGLEPNTTYHIAAFEFNGANEPAYLKTNPPVTSFTTVDVPGATVPTTAASNPSTDNVDGNKLTLKWNSGNGNRRIVVMRAGNAVTFVPVAGTSYTQNSSFSSGADLGDGQYVVYNNTGASADITNLQPSTTYHFTVFEFNGTGTLIRYLTSAVLAGTVTTAIPPATPVSNVQATPGATSLAITWNSGTGSGRLVVMREANAVQATPAALSVYPANSVFKSGVQIIAGEYVVFAGSGNGVTVTGLQANKTYHYSIFEYNGSTAPVYNTTTVVRGSATISSTLPISLLYFRAKDNNGQVLLTWATAQEVNNAFFTVERSRDGASFEAIKTIAGAGNSNHTIEYSYADAQAGSGKSWYRLKQTDLDGRFTYSNIATIEQEATGKGVNIYPNPVQGRFKVEWTGNSKDGILSAFDTRGVLVKQQKITAGQYINSVDWKAGTYYLTVYAGGKQYSSVLIKQ